MFSHLMLPHCPFAKVRVRRLTFGCAQALCVSLAPACSFIQAFLQQFNPCEIQKLKTQCIWSFSVHFVHCICGQFRSTITDEMFLRQVFGIEVFVWHKVARQCISWSHLQFLCFWESWWRSHSVRSKVRFVFGRMSSANEVALLNTISDANAEQVLSGKAHSYSVRTFMFLCAVAHASSAFMLMFALGDNMKLLISLFRELPLQVIVIECDIRT